MLCTGRSLQSQNTGTCGTHLFLPVSPAGDILAGRQLLSPLSLTLWGLWDKEIQEVLCTVFPNLLRLSQALLSGQRQFEPELSQRAMVKNSMNNKYPPIGKQLLGNYYGRGLGQGVLDCYLNTHPSCDLEWPAQRLSTPFNEARFVYPFS